MSNNIQDASNCMNYEIRCFEWSDIDRYLSQIIDMQLENIYKYHYPEKKPNKNYVKGKIFELKKHLENGNTYFIGAAKGDRLYGYIWCYESIFIDEKRLHINSLFVCKEVRRTGLGQLLMSEVKRIAISNNCDSIGTHNAVFNTAAGKFYSKNGFNPTRIEMVWKLDN